MKLKPVCWGRSPESTTNHWGAQERGQFQISRFDEENVLLNHADQEQNRIIIVPCCHETDPPCEHYGFLSLWSHGYCHHVDTTVMWQTQNYWSYQHHEFLNPGLTRYLWTCCYYGRVVDPALQITRALWTPKPCPSCGFFLSQGPY